MTIESLFLNDKVLLVGLGILALALLLLVIAIILLHSLSRKQAALEKALTESAQLTREKTVEDIRQSFENLKRDVMMTSNAISASEERHMKDIMDMVQKSAETQAKNERGMQDSLVTQLESQARRDEARIQSLTENLTLGLEGMRKSINEQMTGIRSTNETALKEMRTTVEEKLQETLNSRISESFRQVDEQLKSVYNGLGEMRKVAQNVDGLRRVLTNVKTRGTFGEVQLGNLLSEVLTPDQYATNVATRPNSTERVEFAIKLPGKGETGTVYLPIDAKFPLEDYERLLAAAEAADADRVEASAKALESRILSEAEKIHKKYVEVPYTTEFAILYLPVESLWAEVLKRPGLIERVHRESHVTIAGPTVLAALLNSLQLGFKTLAIEKKSAEVFRLLSRVKTEFGKFTEAFENVEKKVDSVRGALDNVRKRTEIMGKKLKDVESATEEVLPASAEDAVAQIAHEKSS